MNSTRSEFAFSSCCYVTDSNNVYSSGSTVQVQVILRPTVSRPVRLGVVSLLELVT
jgi:hypothetical protein